MSDFNFEDSKPNQEKKDRNDIASLLQAVDSLNKLVAEGEIPFISLSAKNKAYGRDIPNIIEHRATEFKKYYNSKDIVVRAVFDVSHYIGSYSTKLPDGEIVTINIQPRWGNKIRNYLLQYTTGVYLPPDDLKGSVASSYSAEWLLVFLWKSVFNQTLRRSHTPKEYRKKKTNDRFFKGFLDVGRQIKVNIADQSRFCCVYAPQTMDITINQTIRYVFRLLRRRNKSFAGLLGDINGYDERLAAFGVQDRDVSVKEIDDICYSRMSEGYRHLMQVGKAIIRRFGASAADVMHGQSSFFIDISEIWENYLCAILRKHLPSEKYRVINPNESGGEWLINGELRSIRPDLIIENVNSGLPVAILDAKYKRYREIGKTEKTGVSREDLYQMTTYLYHFGMPNVSIKGLFISPFEGKSDIHTFVNHKEHSIGVVNFNLDQWEKDDKFEIDKINESEKVFAELIAEHLL